MEKNRIAEIDFETRSPCDIRKHGAWLYAKHPETEIMCLYYMLPDMNTPKAWFADFSHVGVPQSPPPADLFEHIANGGLIEAHNAFFEKCIWHHVAERVYGWPAVPASQWRCSAAKASAWSLPRDLESAAMAAGVQVQKDMAGRALMLKMCKPRRAKKGPRYHETKEDILRLGEYCATDVLAQRALSRALPELDEKELALWQATEDMNWRGLRFDLEMAHKAINLATDWKKEVAAEFKHLTGIESASQRAAIKNWLNTVEGLDLPDTRGQTLEYYLDNVPLSERARRVINITIDANKTSTRKYAAIIDRTDPDDWRARDFMMYYGAATGRWAGKGVQVHNIPGRNIVEHDFEAAADAIKTNDLKWCMSLYSNLMAFLSGAIRGCIVPEEGYEFAIADYSAIEARVLVWLAGDTKAIDVFERGDDIYCDMASEIYGRKITPKDKKERQLGKAAVLGLGYGMGAVTFLLTIRSYKIKLSKSEVRAILKGKYEYFFEMVKADLGFTDDEGKKEAGKIHRKRLIEAFEDPKEVLHELALMRFIVSKYRNRYDKVTEFWNVQNNAAIEAVARWRMDINAVKDTKPYCDTPQEQLERAVDGPLIKAGKITWQVKSGYLLAQMPDGGFIKYKEPNVGTAKTLLGEDRAQVTYMSVNGVTRKWERTATYGGKIAENIAQRVARDIIAAAILRSIESKKYIPIMSVHDELVSMVRKGEGNAEEYVSLLCHKDEWLEGCPINAEGEIATRYKK